MVLDEASGDVPDFPLDDASSRELFWWDRLWHRPQSSQWNELHLEDEVALPMSDAEELKPATLTHLKAKKAADARWSKHRASSVGGGVG
ncbi:hypothetical protein ACQCSX_08760 [Pseudarthrobacter sp. P1]|uniref:hypothetical protein n=1 Tax=Pseudarthrobacter sp. P1 TaxID=3418418 RepID=UPI003CE67CF1